jgi:hypothetical protein
MFLQKAVLGGSQIWQEPQNDLPVPGTYSFSKCKEVQKMFIRYSCEHITPSYLNMFENSVRRVLSVLPTNHPPCTDTHLFKKLAFCHIKNFFVHIKHKEKALLICHRQKCRGEKAHYCKVVLFLPRRDDRRRRDRCRPLWVCLLCSSLRRQQQLPMWKANGLPHALTWSALPRCIRVSLCTESGCHRSVTFQVKVLIYLSWCHMELLQNCTGKLPFLKIELILSQT